MGTMAHSWVMSFPGEEEAFEAYAELYPDKTIFLIDTYDTLKSGIHSAIKAGKKLKERGENFGVRLDSGDIHYLSAEARRLLDQAGFPDAGITVSNDLDETIIETLVKGGAPVNTWGVGTRLVSGDRDSAFTGVYKLAASENAQGALIPVMKFSDNPEKTTNPAVKQVMRVYDSGGAAVADILCLDEKNEDDLPEKGKRCRFWHPAADYRYFYHTIEGGVAELLKKRLEKGELCAPLPSLAEIKKHTACDLDTFDSSYKRLLNPHVYKVSISEKLRSLKLALIQNHLGDL